MITTNNVIQNEFKWNTSAKLLYENGVLPDDIIKSICEIQFRYRSMHET
jgi:hypothetical protein